MVNCNPNYSDFLNVSTICVLSQIVTSSTQFESVKNGVTGCVVIFLFPQQCVCVCV